MAFWCFYCSREKGTIVQAQRADMLANDTGSLTLVERYAKRAD